ncbi:conserved protein of unknown function [Ruminococcaceae bacterium BL-6]|nr:conserved protein of unknown function [Ruminococcaceae bacterium BL-6]
MQVKFQDGTTLDALVVNGKSVYAQGATRDALEIQIAKGGITMDALDTLTADTAKTSKLTLIDGDQQYVHDNYNIRTELALRPVVVTPATGTDPAVTEDRLIVTLAQLTYQEQQAAQLAATQAAQADAIAELSILVSGGNA